MQWAGSDHVISGICLFKAFEIWSRPSSLVWTGWRSYMLVVRRLIEKATMPDIHIKHRSVEKFRSYKNFFLKSVVIFIEIMALFFSTKIGFILVGRSYHCRSPPCKILGTWRPGSWREKTWKKGNIIYI